MILFFCWVFICAIVFLFPRAFCCCSLGVPFYSYSILLLFMLTEWSLISEDIDTLDTFLPSVCLCFFYLCAVSSSTLIHLPDLSLLRSQGRLVVLGWLLTQKSARTGKLWPRGPSLWSDAIGPLGECSPSVFLNASSWSLCSISVGHQCFGSQTEIEGWGSTFSMHTFTESPCFRHHNPASAVM